MRIELHTKWPTNITYYINTINKNTTVIDTYVVIHVAFQNICKISSVPTLHIAAISVVLNKRLQFTINPRLQLHTTIWGSNLGIVVGGRIYKYIKLILIVVSENGNIKYLQ